MVHGIDVRQEICIPVQNVNIFEVRHVRIWLYWACSTYGENKKHEPT